MPAGANAIDLIEACYRVELDERAWLQAVAETAAEVLRNELGAVIYLYDRKAGEQPRMGTMCFSRDFDPSWVGRFTSSFASTLPPGSKDDAVRLTLDFFARALHGRCGAISAVPSLAPALPLIKELGGAHDMYTLNAYDPSGCGVGIGLPRRRRMPRSPGRDALFARVTTHLAAAQRLRRRLPRNEPPAGLLTPEGKLVHAEGAEVAAARSALTRSLMRLTEARSTAGRRNSERATNLWKGLVAARWTLLDDFSHDGSRFVVVRRNDAASEQGPASLSERERQILAHAALGRSNKVIAYELGLAASTVRVLLHRAAAKLGAHGRAEAVARFLAAGRR